MDILSMEEALVCFLFLVQWETNGGKCGLCGDPWQEPKPRRHEAGGRYANGIITRRYSPGQVIDVEVELTANHYGHFVLRICPVNNPKAEASQECLNKYPLYVVDSRNDSYLFNIPEKSKKKDTFRYQVKLPDSFTCSHCVIQWIYTTGNTWGLCENKTEAQGCGPQESFRNCADVAITTNTAGFGPPQVNTNEATNSETPASGTNSAAVLTNSQQSNSVSLEQTPFLSSVVGPSITGLVVRDQVCLPVKPYSVVSGMDEWCKRNCLKYLPFCPEHICHCPSSCEAIGDIAGQEGADVYCHFNCLRNPPTCPQDRCLCY